MIRQGFFPKNYHRPLCKSSRKVNEYNKNQGFSCSRKEIMRENSNIVRFSLPSRQKKLRTSRHSEQYNHDENHPPAEKTGDSSCFKDQPVYSEPSIEVKKNNGDHFNQKIKMPKKNNFMITSNRKQINEPWTFNRRSLFLMREKHKQPLYNQNIILYRKTGKPQTIHRKRQTDVLRNNHQKKLEKWCTLSNSNRDMENNLIGWDYINDNEQQSFLI